MNRVKEDEIQKWLEKEENYGNIIDLIENSNILENSNKENLVPFYSLDYIIKNKILKSARYVYKNLHSLKLVIANRNISMNKTERLYPDLLLFNEETATFIIVEIKRSDKAEREAMTELLAYEHELQNLFPFMSKIEVCFVIISADYKPLLEHSIYSFALWQNRKILPLKIDGIKSSNSKNWKLSVHIPDSWSLLSTGTLKPEQINTVNLVLYDKEAYSDYSINIKDKDDNVEILKRGLELIVKEGEKNSASGFVLLSKLTNSELAKWNITIGVINPYSFFKLLEYESKIKIFFEEYRYEFNTKCTIDLAINSQKYLEIFYAPRFETFTNWSFTKKELQEISNPILIDFFGEVDDMVNNFVLNEQVRKYYYPELNDNRMNWKEPLIGLNLLDNLLEDNIFFDGKYSFLNIYKFGTKLGILGQYLNVLQNIIEPETNPYTNYFLGKYKWAEIEFIKAYREIGLRYNETSDISDNFITFKSLKIDMNENVENISAISTWILNSFLKETIHKKAFNLGLIIQNYFYDKKLVTDDGIIFIEKSIIEATHQMINIEFEKNELVQARLLGKLDEYKNIINLDNKYDYSKISNEVLINAFEEYTLPLYSQIIMEVSHKVDTINSSAFDFSFLKEAYPKEYKKNNKSVVNLAVNGYLGIIIVTDKDINQFLLLLGKINPEKELLFLNNKGGGMGILRKLTWNEFENMEF